MNTYSDAPTSFWNLPAWSPWAALLAIAVLALTGWWVFTPGPNGRLVPADIAAEWPFADREVDVFCRLDSPVLEVDGARYALTSELHGQTDLQTFDLDMSDDVWLVRDGGTKVSLGPVTEAATQICDAT